MSEHQIQKMRVLLLGGTTEASELARRLSGDERFDAVLSLAGRTVHPLASPIRVRVGGFGGVAGLTDYLRVESIAAVVDATHPFAAQISANAIEACHLAGVTLIALERPAWEKVSGDMWHHFSSVEVAIAALPRQPMRLFSGLGRLSLDALKAAPQHHWVIRVIDQLETPPDLLHATIITARGPFKTDDDIALFKEHAIEVVLAKNAGGQAAYAKIEAARVLHLPVYMIGRPVIPPRAIERSVDEAWAQLGAHHASLANRGV